MKIILLIAVIGLSYFAFTLNQDLGATRLELAAAKQRIEQLEKEKRPSAPPPNPFLPPPPNGQHLGGTLLDQKPGSGNAGKPPMGGGPGRR